MRFVRGTLGVVTVALLVSACSPSTPQATPAPTPAPRASTADAAAAADAFVAAWDAKSYLRLYGTLSAEARHAVPYAAFRELLGSFDDLADVYHVTATLGDPERVVLPAEPMPVGPTASPGPSTPPAASDGSRPTSSPAASPSPSGTPVPPGTPADGPIPGLAIPLQLHVSTGGFGDVELDRRLVLVEENAAWKVRWSPDLLFPELDGGGHLELARNVPVRGRIVGQDGTVWAETRDDGIRVYPQEWLAGQTIGYVGEVNSGDLKSMAREGWRAGDMIGRSGLELGADNLLRGTVGLTLKAVTSDGESTALLTRDAVPGADLVITLRRSLQATAQQQIAGYAEAGTAVIDPKSGDVWALASAPVFNPNAMTLGTTLSGQDLAETTFAQRLSHATYGTYPAGSSFKVFTLAAALKTGVAGPDTRMSCNGTWPYNGFTFHNYMDHHLAGLVDLKAAMAFSCNTTYMPLSILVYEKDQTALTDMVRDFGFGQLTGMKYLGHARGILPDARYFEMTDRWDGVKRPYNGFDQVQLAIGQGSFLGSPLQLANAYAAIGNGGTLWQPRIVVEARRPDGTVVEQVPTEVQRNIPLTKDQLAYVVDTMQAVVDYPYGTAYGPFRGFGIPVAGKSGTAETGGPNPDAWFPAIAPADDPEISVATVLVRVPLATGGSDAAPLVRRVMAQYFSER